MVSIYPPFDSIARSDIAVVGGGIIGLSTAYAAAVRGAGHVKVRLYEAVETGHPGAASTDQNRVFRHLHGPDSWHTVWAKEAGIRWEQIAKASARDLLRRVGVLFLVHRDSDPGYVGGHVWPFASPGEWMAASLKVLDDQKVQYQRLTPEKLSRRFPQFNADVMEEAVLDQEAGFLEANVAVSALLELCQRAGVEYRPHTRVARVSSDSSSCVLELDGGKEERAGAAVVALNGWTNDLLPLPEGALRLNEQPVLYLTPPKAGEALTQSKMPVFISLSTDCYGFPAHNGVIKVGDDNPYRPINHPNQRAEVEEGEAARVVEMVAWFIPSLMDARVERTHMCFYDRSKDGNFILDAWDGNARVVYGCGMSGRAFKFAPVIGERLARFAVTGERPTDLEGLQVR